MTLTFPMPADAVGDRDKMNLDATNDRLVERILKKHGGSHARLENDPEFRQRVENDPELQRQADIIERWRKAFQRKEQLAR